MFLTILVGSFLLLFILHCLIRYSRKGRFLHRIPGPKEYPIIGNFYHLYILNEHIIEKIWEMCEDFYPIYKLWSFFFNCIFILHPEDIKVLLSSKKYGDKSMPYNCIQDWLSTGLLTSKGNKWEKRRKLLTPAFHFNILNDYVSTFNKEARFFINSLKEEANEGFIIKDLFQLIPKYTLNAICETIMGISLRDKGKFEEEYLNAIRTFGEIVVYRFTKPWYHISSIFAFSSVARLQRKTLKTLRNFSKEIIAEKRRYHKQTNYKYLQFDDVTSKGFDENPVNKKPLCMLDLLIAASVNNNEIDDEGIQEEVDTFIFEGHDTTAVALSFALSLIAKHKDVQENIRKEVSTVMRQEEKLTISTLKKLSYLERCIKESLRLYPSVYLIFRHLSEDLKLKNYLVPAGSVCALNIYSLHRNPEYWSNPNDFDPDRFLPENMKDCHFFSYIPFSAGSRNCIGQKFAILELKIFIAYILYNFYIEPVDELDDVKFSTILTLHPLQPFHVKFIPL